MEQLTLGELREVLLQIEKALECSVCLETLRDSCRQCRRGHAVCTSCAKPLHECPMCRGELSDHAPAALNDVVRLLPRTCRYQDNGCDAVVIPSRGGHEVICGYRDTSCRLKDCTWAGLVDDVLNHLQCDHPTSPVHTVGDQPLRWPQLSLLQGNQTITPVFAFNTVIWAVAEVVDSQDVHISFQSLPTKVLPALIAVVGFKKGEIEFTNSVPVVKVSAVKLQEKYKVVLSNSRFKLFSTPRGLVHTLKIIKGVI